MTNPVKKFLEYIHYFQYLIGKRRDHCMEPHLKSLTESKYCSIWHDQDVRPDPCPPLVKDEKCQLLIVGE